MRTGTLHFWNSRKNYGVASVGKDNVYLKRYHVTNPKPPADLEGGMEVEFDTELNGMDVRSTCDLTPKAKEQ